MKENDDQIEEEKVESQPVIVPRPVEAPEQVEINMIPPIPNIRPSQVVYPDTESNFEGLEGEEHFLEVQYVDKHVKPEKKMKAKVKAVMKPMDLPLINQTNRNIEVPPVLSPIRHSRDVVSDVGDAGQVKEERKSEDIKPKPINDQVVTKMDPNEKF